MPIDYNEDLMPRNAPKPAPLIEMAATPLVPEVSLLLDQDRNKSLHINTTPSVHCVESRLQNTPHEEQKQVPCGNQFESYNTWKAKNAQLLSAITGSSGGPETVARYSSSRKCNGIQRTQSNDKEVYHSEEGKNVGSLPLTRQAPCANRVNKQMIAQQYINSQDRPFGFAQPGNNNYSQSRSKEEMHSRQYQYPNASHIQTKSCFPVMTSNENSPIDKYMYVSNIHSNTPYDSKRQQNNIEFPEHTRLVPDYSTNQRNSNEGQCHCVQGQCGVASNNRFEYVNSRPFVSREERSKEMQTPNLKSLSPLDIAHINNQAIIDLYHIIHLQNEQIVMLQQQVKQVLQIHLDCEKSMKQNFNCRNCPCEQKNNCTSIKATCANSQKESGVKNRTDKCSSSSNTENVEKPKRSIGVMTSSIIENSQDNHINVGMQTENQSSLKAKQKKKWQNNPISAPPNISNHPDRKGLLNEEERGRKKIVSSTAKKTNQVESNPVDNSFSLNEAGLLIRATSEQDDLSPNTSVHVDLQDYYSSSVESESDATASSSNEYEQNSESEDNASDPQLGWTFYNRVVGQVNNILKKTPTPPRKEHPQMYRTPAGQMYGLNAEYETDNNWSKRVTFDGPPLDDSDNNMPDMRELPKFNQPMPRQDMRMNDGPGRMQDFMMYNFANGSTNLSFATLRYLDRYNLLPSPRNSKQPEQMYQGYQTSNKKYVKKKTRNSEKYSKLPPQMNKRKSSTPSSKVLDITGLKQQPKLF